MMSRERKIEVLTDLIARGQRVTLTLDGAGTGINGREVMMGMPLHLAREYGGRWAVKLVLRKGTTLQVEVIGLTKILQIKEWLP